MIKSTVAVLALAALLGFASAMPASSFDTDVRRIVNGTDTTIERIPFQVSILFFNSQWCGASILDENTLITAAHCFDWYFDGFNALSSWTIRAGSSYWAEGGEVIQLESVVRHEQYDPDTFDFDVAIVKLSSSVTFSDSVQRVLLAQSGSELAAGQDVQVSGWGRLTVS